MANVTGDGGSITLPTGFNPKVDGWSATLTINGVEVTDFDSGDFEEYELTNMRLEGSFTGQGEYNASSTAPLPTGTLATSSFSGAMVLTAISGCTFSFTGKITGMDFDRPHAGKLAVGGNFRSSGTITVAWDETA